MDAAEINVEPVIQSSQDKIAQSTGARLAHHWTVALVLAVTFLAYAGTLRFQFVYDDIHQITENPTVQSWRFAPGYFTRNVWGHQDGYAQGNYYRPVFLLWLLINFMSFGLEPSMWHLTTVLAHVLATLMLYHLAYRLAKDQWIAGVAALIFGLHPVHIEAVAWVSGVTESLLAIMFIPSLLCYFRKRELDLPAQTDREGLLAKRWRSLGWLAASLALYAMALLSKETAVVLPLVVFTYEWTFHKPARKYRSENSAEGNNSVFALSSILLRVITALKRIIPFLAVTALYFAVRAIALKAIFHPLKGETISKVETILTAPSILLFYIKQLVWPVGLSGFYDLEPVNSLSSSAFVMPLAALTLISIALWRAIRWFNNTTDRRIAVFALAIILLPVLPVLNISFFRDSELVHDRYLYLPSIGFSILVALALRRINVSRAKLFGQPAFQIVSALALSGALGFATAYQHVYWSNDLLLYQHELSIAPNSSGAKNNLGNIFSKNGLYEEAIALFHQAADRSPGFWEPVYNLGYNYYKLGKYEEAEQWLRRSGEINKTNANQYLTLGVMFFETNRLDEAEAALRRGIELKRDGFGLHYALGAVLKTKGDLYAALDEFKMELAYNPRYLAATEQIAGIERHLSAVTGNQNK